jgi:precorrin-6B methylase 2
VRIANNARKHGITDEEMLHAIANHTRKYQQGDGVLMYVGASGRGTNIIEVAVLSTAAGDDVVIHAMPVRSKFWP